MTAKRSEDMIKIDMRLKDPVLIVQTEESKLKDGALSGGEVSVRFTQRASDAANNLKYKQIKIKSRFDVTKVPEVKASPLPLSPIVDLS